MLVIARGVSKTLILSEKKPQADRLSSSNAGMEKRSNSTSSCESSTPNHVQQTKSAIG